MFALGRQAQAMGSPVPKLGVTYYKTIEEQLALEKKKEEERKYVSFFSFILSFFRSFAFVLSFSHSFSKYILLVTYYKTIEEQLALE